MGKKLYVGNLDSKVTGEDLAHLFAPYGTVESAKVVSDHGTGGSYGYVQMGSEEQAAAAVSALNGADRAGRQISVNELGGEEDRGPAPGDFGDRGGEWPRGQN